MTLTRKHLIAVAAAAAVLASVALLARPGAVEVDTATAAIQPLQVTVDEEGMTRVRHRYLVTSPVTGRLQRIALDEGDRVAAGEVLVHISPIPLDARSEAQARARVEAAEALQREADAQVALERATLDEAVRRAARAESLAVANLVAPEELELARLDEETARRRLHAAEFRSQAAAYDLDAARAALLASSPDRAIREAECVELRAPVDGVVLRVREENERVVQPGTPLLELGDPATLEIVVDLLSTDAVRVQPGATMIVEDWGGDAPLDATVRMVEPSGFTKVSALGVEEQRVNVIADFADPPRRLGDGFRVETRTVLWESGGVLAVPWSALVRRGEAWGVFVTTDGRAAWRDVTVGHRGTLTAEITEGLAEGERVIVHPGAEVEAGARVRERR